MRACAARQRESGGHQPRWTRTQKGRRSLHSNALLRSSARLSGEADKRYQFCVTTTELPVPVVLMPEKSPVPLCVTSAEFISPF